MQQHIISHLFTHAPLSNVAVALEVLKYANQYHRQPTYRWTFTRTGRQPIADGSGFYR